MKSTNLVRWIEILRWAIPLATSLVGIGFVLVNEVLLEGHQLVSLHTFLTSLALGVIIPVFAWFTLTWAARLAQAEAVAQHELTESNRELAVLNVIGEVAAQSLELDAILEMCLGKVREIIGLDAVEMRVVEEGRLVLKSHHGVSKEFLAREKTILLGHCLCGMCAQRGELLGENNLLAQPALINVPCVKEGFQSTLSIPMKTKGSVVGVIHIASRSRDAFGAREQQILTAIAQRIAMVVENARLYEAARHRAAHLEAASLVGQRVSALLNLNSLLAEVVRLIRDKFGYYHVHILLVEEETRELVLREASGCADEQLKARGLRLRIGHEGITGWVAHTGQSLLCNDVRREPHYYKAELLDETRSELAVPLRVGTRVIGVLDVQSDRCDAFEKEDITVLQILGNQLGIAIENARLFEETSSRYQALMALHETSLDIISQLDKEELLQSLLRRGVHLWGARAGNVFLYDPVQEQIHNAASLNTSFDWSGIVLRPGQSVIGQVIQTGKPMLVNDYEKWPGRIEVFADNPWAAVMAAPLHWHGQVFGGIGILDTKARHFDQGDLWLLTLFADLAAIAIKNAELHTQVKEFSQVLENKVVARTRELSSAKEEIALKAELLRSLLAKTIHLQEKERARIAREMHDGVIQLITALRYEVKATKVTLGSELEPVALEKLNALREILDEMEKEIRHAIYDLHPPALDAVDLLPALHKYAQSFAELSGIACELRVTGTPLRLPVTTEVAVFRIVEEALQNAAAHSQASATTVTLNFGAEQLCVEVHDNGCGFNYAEWSPVRNGKHLGLVSMEERIRSLDGTMQISSNVQAGTRLKFCFPLRRNEVEGISAI